MSKIEAVLRKVCAQAIEPALNLPAALCLYRWVATRLRPRSGPAAGCRAGKCVRTRPRSRRDAGHDREPGARDRSNVDHVPFGQAGGTQETEPLRTKGPATRPPCKSRSSFRLTNPRHQTGRAEGSGVGRHVHGRHDPPFDPGSQTRGLNRHRQRIVFLKPIIPITHLRTPVRCIRRHPSPIPARLAHPDRCRATAPTINASSMQTVFPPQR